MTVKITLRFPFTTAASVVAAIVALAAVIGGVDVIQMPLGLAGRIERRWVDDIVIISILLVTAITVDVNRAGRAAADQSRATAAQAEREFRALFLANPLPMWIYDLTTLQFLEVNDAAVQRYGYSRDAFLAMTIKDIRPPEDVERLLTNVSQSREIWEGAGSWRHRVKSGEIIDVDIMSHTITFLGQSAALVVAQDITERKRAEAELLLLNEGIQLQRMQVFKATMRTVQDIVGNALMSLHMFRTHVESSASQEALALFDETIGDTAAKLKALGDLDRVVETQMAVGAGIDFQSTPPRSDG